jgi:hypothetical protein
MFELAREGREGALLRRGADVDLADHRIVPGPERAVAKRTFERGADDAPAIGVAILLTRG